MGVYLGHDKVAGPGAFCNVSGKASKNLFNKNYAPVIKGFSTSTSIISGGSGRITYIPCKPNTTYTIQKIASTRFIVSCSASVPTIGVAVTRLVNAHPQTTTTVTTNSTAKYLILDYYDSDADEQSIRDSIQIELGSTATEYEEYYEPIISVKDSNGDYHEVPYVTGKASKNLYDKKTVHIEGASNQNASNEIPVLPNTTYTFSIGKYTYGEVKEFDNSGVQINDIGGSESSKIITFTTSSNAKYITTLFFTGTYNNVSLNEIDFTQIQLELGSTATEYEEYYEPTLSIRTSNGTFREVKNEVETTTNITMADGYTLSGAAFEKKPILIKYGKVVQLAMLVVSENGFPDTLTGIGRLPEGYRPKYTQVFPCGLANAHLWYMDKVGYLNIGADGYINIRNSTGTQKYAFINVTFMTD